MLIPRIQRIKKTLLAALRAITAESGAQYTPAVREVDDSDIGNPQSDVEITLQPTGFEYLPDNETAIGHTEVFLYYQVDVTVSGRLANDATPIDEVCLVVCADVEKAIMADYTQGNDAQNTSLDRAIVNSEIPQGYYGWTLLFRVHATYAIDDPFSR